MAHKPTLNILQEKFVAEYLRTGDAANSVIAAGYQSKDPKSQGRNLLKLESVKNAVDAARGQVRAKGIHDLERAMLEAEEAMAFAKTTKNANAFVKAVELRSKLNGLLVEKHDVRQIGFNVTVEGIDFSKRDGELKAAVDIPVISKTPDEDDGGDLLA